MDLDAESDFVDNPAAGGRIIWRVNENMFDAPFTEHLIPPGGPVPGHLGELAQLRGVEGEIPSRTAVPSGCRFHPRCPFAQARCREEVPAFEPIGDRHAVACHFPLDRALAPG